MMKLALIQLYVTANKTLNIERACKFIAVAANEGAQLICLPECFNSPYGTNYFPEYAESIPSGPTSKALSEAAELNGVYLVGGSLPENDNGKLFNTCLAFGPDGCLLMKYRKTHLFDIDIPGKITFKESENLSAGNTLGVFETPFCKVGVGICYDLRFNKLAEAYAKKDCQLLLYPGAFNMTTGPLHWELLQRSRATDNQLFVASVSPARDESASYVAWGHSTVVDPWGKVLQSADEKEQILYVDLDMSAVGDVRNQIPIRKQQRNDLYDK